MYRKLAMDFFNNLQKVSCKEHQKHISSMLKGERFVLLYLLKNGPSFPGKIAEDMGSSTANIAKILRNLEERQFICHKEEKTDKRKKLVSLSEVGNNLIMGEMEQVIVLVTSLFEKMGEQDAKEFIRLMQRFLEVSMEIEDKDK